MIRLLKKILLTKIKCNGQFSFHSASERIFIYYLYGNFCFCQRAEKFKNLLLSGMVCGFIAAASIASLMFKDMEIGARVRFSVVTTLLIMMVLVAIIKFWFGRKIAR